MYGKIQIKGTIEILTGMHIGGSSAFAAIGAVDSPVIKDPISNMPIIPGSSLKGKMRALLAKAHNKTTQGDPNNDAEELTKLFGSSKKGDFHVSKVLFRDSILENWNELKDKGLTSKTEVKFENNISRTTSVANPRQIERVVRGSKFPLDLVYEIDNEATKDMVIKDMEILKEGLKLLEMDYLGGNGSRGYGRVKFENVTVTLAIGEVEQNLIDNCNDVFKEV